MDYTSHVTNLGCLDNGGARVIEVWIREVPLYVHVVHIRTTCFYLGGLDEHFKKPPEPDCIIKYMISFKDQEKCIFRNYKILFLHVFKGLQYLHSKGIVHGDVKGIHIYNVHVL